MRTLLMLLCFALIAPQAIYAISLTEAQAEADAWVVARKDTITSRVLACVTEGDPRICHTAWAASVTPNTAATDSQLATVTLDDPGRFVDTVCGGCYVDRGKFSQAGIAIPATAPVNARLHIWRSKAGWGAVLEVEIKYEGALYRRAWGAGIATGHPWVEVAEP